MFGTCLNQRHLDVAATVTEFPAHLQSLAAKLVASPEFKRLAGIAFLGAIDRFHTNGGGSGSRYEHSLGVAKLILNFEHSAPFSEGEWRIALVHALIHDIGHGPYSHSSEPFFRAVFGIDHHSMLLRIIEDRASPVSSVLRSFGLWHDYRRFLRKPDSLPVLQSLFTSPINVDTIEGILRAARFFGIQSPVEEREIVHALLRKTVAVKPLDQFWSLKGEVYNEHIFGDTHGPADHALTEALFSVREHLSEADFRLTDSQLEDRFQQLGTTFSYPLPIEGKRRERHFEINDRIIPTRRHSLASRYVEGKTPNACNNSGVQKVH